MSARARLIAYRVQCGDALPGDFVRLISGSRLGLVESINGEFATVSDLARPGHKEIVPVSILMRVVAT
jgi:hypothetical protein